MNSRTSLPLWAWLLLLVVVGGGAFWAGQWTADRPPAGPEADPVALSPGNTAQVQATFTPTAVPTVAPVTRGDPPLEASPVATEASQAYPAPTALPESYPPPDMSLCAAQPDEEVADLYRPELGCAQAEAQVVWAAWQPFEGGEMLWRRDTEATYVFLAEGSRLVFPEPWAERPWNERGDPPEGLQAPIRGFGFVWGEHDQLFQDLGWARDEERGICARVQDFERGFLLISSPAPICTPENYYNHAAQAGWTPLRLAAGPVGRWWR